MTRALVVPALALALSCMLAAGQKHPGSKQPSATTADTAPDPLQEAEDLLQKQQYAAAEEKLNKLVADQSANPQAWFDLGFAESHLGKNPDAIAAYRKAAELSPKWFEANLNLGVALARSGQYPEAAAALQTAVQLQPVSGGKPVLAKAWFALGQVLESTDPAAARSAYSKACELDPSDQVPCQQPGNVQNAVLVGNLVKDKRFAEAEGLLRKYLAQHPNDPAGQVQLGRILALEGKPAEAIASLEAANASSDPAVARALAELYSENKQYDRAAALFKGLVEKNAADPEVHLGFGNTLEHLHKYPEAEAELLLAVQSKPDLAEAYYGLSFAAQQNKHYELSLRALDVRARYLPEDAGTYWLRAVCYDSLGAYKPAAQNYRLFLSVSNGKAPDEEFKARHRLEAIEH
ncbi:MAG TPA: tetratricopeptide repeat protein [Verrucomicrobiae bacterium]|jgi:tetratricopeptide (TPR) repeat protein|nr:tetratricopeptide repeat protein [Verrucomicrobiae bacterium]